MKIYGKVPNDSFVLLKTIEHNKKVYDVYHQWCEEWHKYKIILANGSYSTKKANFSVTFSEEKYRFAASRDIDELVNSYPVLAEKFFASIGVMKTIKQVKKDSAIAREEYKNRDRLT